MRLPKHAQTSRPWRVHEITGDFTLEDVWALPTPGGPDEFHLLVRSFASGDVTRDSSRVVRLLFALRFAIGRTLGWDGAEHGLGEVSTLRERLPPDLRDGERGPDLGRFTSLYLTHDEWAAEIANRTVHGVLHLGWVPDGAGGWRGQMSVYAKPNGLLGSVYMRAINPFRHLLVYPAIVRQIGRRWQAARAPAA